MTRGSSRLAIVVIFTSLLSAACGNARPEEPPSACESIVILDGGPEAGAADGGPKMGCGPRQHCDTAYTTPRCVCDDGYTGDFCDTCDDGYEEMDRTCVPMEIDCSSNPGICGRGGNCTSLGGVDYCSCDQGYTGLFCSNCASGYQDKDMDGSCEENCLRAMLTCTGRRVCSDESGMAVCTCARGYAGTSCDVCDSGYLDVEGDGVCVPTCSVAELDCGEHGDCSDRTGYPRCVCDIGYAGTECEACAPSHLADGTGRCYADPPAGYTLLATATGEGDQPLLAALNPVAYSVFPLTRLEQPLSAIAYDTGSGTLWGSNSSGQLYVVDRRYGTVMPVTLSTSISSARGLTFDASRGVLYAIGSGRTLYAISPVSGAVASQDLPSEFFWGSESALAHDASIDRILGVGGGSGSETAYTFEIDPSTFVYQRGAPIAFERAVGSLALAIDETTGQEYAAGNIQPTRTEWLHAYCRAISEALGFAIPDSPATGEYADTIPTGATTLTTSGRNPQLVSYGSYGSRTSTPRQIRVATTHPDSVACIVTYEEPLEVVVAATAQFHFLIVVSTEPGLRLMIESGFTAQLEGVPPIRIRGGSDGDFFDPSILPMPMGTAPPDLVRFYDNTTWYALGIETSSFGEGLGTPSLIALDWASGGIFARPLDVKTLSGGLAPFGGAP